VPDSSPPAVFAAVDVTTLNFEAELLQPSLTQPVLVIFWTPRSEASIALGSLLELVAGEYNGSLRLARINVDSEAQVASMFGVRSIPTVILMRDGQPADGFAGALPEAEIRELLGRHIPAPAAVEESADVEATKPEETPEQAIARLQQEIAAKPDQAELKLDLAVALMQSGNATAAVAELASLPANLETDDRAKRVRGQLEFAELLKDAPTVAELEARVASDPADLVARDLLGVRLLIDGQSEAGLEQFLAILKADRSWNEGQAKKRLIAAFLVLDDADLVANYRRRMSSLLF
jgi:putative thioredoxin